jgi:mannosyltransferase OCH1-like enzyme
MIACATRLAHNHDPEYLYKKRTSPIQTFRKALVRPETKQRIPRVIMQTNSDSRVPKDMAETIRSILEDNPEYEYVYFDDHAAREFISKEYGGRVLSCYDDLNPGAFKADLFRYCYIYRRGGVYIDTGMVSVTPLRKLIRENDEFIAPEDNLNGTGIYNAFMCSTPEHPIIATVLRICLKNIENKDKTSEMLTVTGPGALCNAFREEVGFGPTPNKDYGNGIRLIRHIGGNRLHKDSNNIVGEIDQDGVTILKTKYPTYYLDRVWYHKKEHYGVLWNKDEVFHSVMRGDRLPNSTDLVGCPPQITIKPEEQILDKVTISSEPLSSDAHSSKSQRIPKIIAQTNESTLLPARMVRVMKKLRRMNPEYAYEYFDSKRRRKFIRDNFDRDVLFAYDSLNPGAFQADLFRYCYLYRKGGIYADSGIEPFHPFRTMIGKDDVLIIPEDDGGKRAWNGFMCAVPKLELFKLTIDSIVKHCKERFYGDSALDITGPNLLGRVFRKIYEVECDEKLFESGRHSTSRVRVIRYSSSFTLTGRRCKEPGEVSYDGIPILRTKYYGYYEDMAWYQKKEQYDVYWQLRQVYV